MSVLHRYRGAVATVPYVMALAGIGGCSTPATTEAVAVQELHSGERAGTAPRVPAAMCNGVALTWERMTPLLAESSGAEVLEETILDMQVAARLAARGIQVNSEDRSREEELVCAALSPDRNRALELLDAVRTRSGLGPTRWQALLERNAALRALVREDVVVTEVLVAQAHESLHGTRRKARIIVAPDLATAKEARRRIDSGERFGEVAAQLSADPSAARGGIVEPISRVDPAYPAVVREALFALPPAATSEAIVVDGSFVLIAFDGEVLGDGATLNDTRGQCERAARTAQERLAMDQLARALLREAEITVFDPSLFDAWKRANKSW